jgi:hypothetical protein
MNGVDAPIGRSLAMGMQEMADVVKQCGGHQIGGASRLHSKIGRLERMLEL